MIGYRVGRVLTNVLIYLVFAVALVAVAYPVVWMISSSLRPTAEIFSDPLGLPTAPSLDNYARALITGNFALNLFNSAVVTIPAVSLIVLFSATAGYAFARLRFRGNRVLFYLLLIGVMVPPQAILITVFQVVLRLGLINNFVGLILVYLSWAPVAIFILTTFFRGIPREILEAAEIDGAGIWRTFWLVALPLARPALATVAIFYFVWIWNDFIYPLILLQDPSLSTIPLGLQQFQGRYRVDWGTQTAALTMALAVPLVIYMFFQDKFVRGLTAGAIK
ncbi:MAG: carbohydrate ABC transporter permease [Microcella sp.]|uniref:carbohydrate ABC transporter permease n=1 Tax=Microcella sp. TaxID=1913979 RepID=UPI003314D0DE